MLSRRPLTALAAPLLLLALAGALVPEVQAADGTTPTATPSATPPPQIASEAAGATAWSPAKPVRIKVTGGTLVAATLTAKDGRQVRGELTATRWTSTGILVPRSTYVLDATAVGPDGQQSILHKQGPHRPPPGGAARHHLPERAHRRCRPAARRDVQPRGTPPGRRRGRAARHHQARHRPGVLVVDLVADRAVPAEEVLAAHTTVNVTADLRKVRAAAGVWGMQDTTPTFRIGRAFVMRVSNAKHLMTVARDGNRIRTFGVSLGKPGFPTRSGTKVVMDTHVSYRMRSTTVGITGGEAYDLDVPYAMRITVRASSCTAPRGTRTSAP